MSKWTQYVDKYGDLSKAWEEIEKGNTEWKDWDYWNTALGDSPTKEQFGQYHWETEGGSKNRTLTSITTPTNTSTQPTHPDLPPYVPPDKPVTPPRGADPEYEGPEYQDWRTYDPIPVGMTLKEVQDDELVENRITSLLDKDSALFRGAAELIMRRNAGRGLGRNASMANEEIMSAIFKVAQPIAMADALMLERHRTLHNTAYYQQMNTRLQGAIQEALSHIAGGYQIQATKINDITNRWKAQLAADIQAYGIDVGAAAKIYGIDVGAATSMYTTDVQKWLGMEGLKVKMADILSGIEDNAEATAFLWDMVFGDNALNPSEWITKWKETYGDDTTTTSGGETTTTGSSSTQWKTHIEAFYTKTKHKHFKNVAQANGVLPWFISKYGE
jgi:hypothetical protein